MSPNTISHTVAIIGGGNAGISLAARLRRSGMTDIGVIEPAESHFYQPLWTLVGGGCAPATESKRSEASVMPQGVGWIKDRAQEVDPDAQTVTTESATSVHYDHLVVCPGIQLDWAAVPGMAESLDTAAVSSNYRYDLAPKTWQLIKKMRSGTAVFTMPSGPIKCGGAPQKIAYLAADYWRRQGVLDAIRVVLVLPTPGMFGVKVFSDELERVVARYGIEVRKNSEVTAVDPDARSVTITDNTDQTTEELAYDLLHVVPRQSAPDWIKAIQVVTSRSTKTPCDTPVSRISSLSEMPGRHRTPKPVPPFASKPPSWQRICRPASPAGRCRPTTVVTHPAP
jgi:sulfide:quinone oxidoreductase